LHRQRAVRERGSGGPLRRRAGLRGLLRRSRRGGPGQDGAPSRAPVRAGPAGELVRAGPPGVRGGAGPRAPLPLPGLSPPEHGLPRRGDRSARARGRGRRGDRPGAGPVGGWDPSPGRAEMITFRDVVRRESTEDKVEYLVSRAALGDAEGVYVEAGELEQGVLDAL